MPRRALTMRQDGRGAITRRSWVSEEKEPGGLFFRSDTPQSRELKAQSMIATRNDHATGEGKQIHIRWALFPKRYPTKQGVEGAIYDCNAQRPCDWGGQRDPTSATMLCIQFGCQHEKPRGEVASGLFVLIFHSVNLVDANG